MKFFLSFLVLLSSTMLCAQVDRDQEQGGELPGLVVKTSRLYGKLIDINTGKGVEAASVQLYSTNAAAKDSFLTGMLSRPNGDFSFMNLAPDSSLRLVISAIGYEPYEHVVSIEAGGDGKRASFEKDLGNISLQPAIKQLGGVTVTSSRPALELGIDRKVFNVSKSLVATGGTAIDVMRNIPTVSVDIDGNVQLRNSSPQIFVDGQPTILTLDQIPADNIERVELITNPSAKFDASSSGGIINVVLKKNKRLGLNGLVTLAGGTPKIFTGNLNLNLREGKFNFFLTGGYNQSGGESKGETKRTNKSNGVVEDFFNQVTVNDRLRRFSSIRFGFDYFIDNRNTITLTQGLVRGRFSNEETQQQEYLDASGSPQYFGYRFADGRSSFNRNSSRFNYKHSFPQQGKELTAEVRYNYGDRSERSGILNTFTLPGGGQYRPDAIVRNEGSSDQDQVTIQIDYANPRSEDSKFETGVRSYHNKFSSVFNAFAVDNGSETKLSLSNNYEYKEMVNAVYATYSGKNNSFSYQVGLRAEHSKFDGLLVDSLLKFGYEYPARLRNIWDALFPSASIAKEINEDQEMQLNYTRRIRRPNFWQLNPFIDINDPSNLRQGNPALRPEFINSFEFNYSLNYPKGNFLGSLYFRNNPDDITQYSDTITTEQYEQLQNAAVDPNAILNTYINASTTNRYGIELTLQHTLAKNLDITPTFELQYRTVKANVNDLDLSNEGMSWEAELSANYKLVTRNKSFFNGFSFQAEGEYESPEVIPQGRRKSEFRVDMAVRKDFLNDKATLTLGVNDVFNTQRFGVIYDTDDFYQDSYRRWNVRNFRLTFTYKFGSADFSIMNRRQESRGEED